MITREELYHVVWAEPMIHIAERFGVSGTYLAQVCTTLEVPRPERGYWAKLAVGKARPVPKLPAPSPENPLAWSQDGKPVRTSRPQAPVKRAKEKKPVRVPRNVVHLLVRGAKQHFEHGRPVEAGAYLKPYKQLLLDVTSSAPMLDRALELASDLYNAFESVGHRVVIAPAAADAGRVRIEKREAAAKAREYWEYSGLWSPLRPTVAYVGSVPIGLAIVEMSENVEMRYAGGSYVRETAELAARYALSRHYSWTTRQDIPSGRLKIVAYSPYSRADWQAQWQETKQSRLRGKIKAIVEAAEAAAPEIVAMLAEADIGSMAQPMARLLSELD